MIQRVSDQSNIKAIDGLFDKTPSIKDHVPEMKQRSSKKADRSWEKNSPAMKFSDKANDLNSSSSNSILPARSGQIKDIGGPNKHIKLESSNSIFSPDNIEKIATNKTNKEKTKIEKESTSQARLEKQKQWNESHSPKIGESLDKGTVVNASCPEGSSDWVPSHKMSMFDTKEFERLKSPNKIENKKAEKDNSWRNPKKTVNTKDISANLIDKLSQTEQSSYTNHRESAVNRLFDAFNKNKE